MTSARGAAWGVAIGLALLVGCRGNRTIGTAAGSPTAIPYAEALSTPAPAATPVVAEASPLALDAGDAVALDAVTTPARADPFGSPSTVSRYTCTSVLAGGPFRSFLAAPDTKVAFVDGDDLLALVNRSPTGALPPSYAPTDLVDVKDGVRRTAAECDSGRSCLRKEARAGLVRMLDQMQKDGVAGRVESAFRGFFTQCWVFGNWAQQARGGFCEATEQSALPGHSQHQLGTTVDLFTEDWVAHGRAFRDGIGCTPGGKWLDQNAWRFGFVVSYPIDPDDRLDGSRCNPRRDHPVPIDPKTGYKQEPWHVRFLGTEAAARFHEAWLASGPDTPQEITLEQWLRGQRGLVGDAELPVCDGCQCGACSTLATDGDKTPCREASLQLDTDGRVLSQTEEPHIVDATAVAKPGGVVVVEVKVHAAAHTPTQTPVTTEQGPTFSAEATFESLAPYPGTRPHRYQELPSAWRVAVAPSGDDTWPWRSSLARSDLAVTWNRANLLLPSRAGDSTVRLRIVAPTATGFRVTLLRDGTEHGTREVPRP